MTKAFNDEELKLMGKTAQGEDLKPKPQRPAPSVDPAAPESIAVANHTIAGRIRKTVGQHSQRIEKLWDQREQVTTHVAEEYAAVLNPTSINQEIACKLIEKVEGAGAVDVPFACEPIELLPVRRFTPSLPSSVGSLPSLA